MPGGKLGKSLSIMQPYWELANEIFPCREILFVLGLLIAFGAAMFIFWLVQRIINLIRGSG